MAFPAPIKVVGRLLNADTTPVVGASVSCILSAVLENGTDVAVPTWINGVTDVNGVVKKGDGSDFDLIPTDGAGTVPPNQIYAFYVKVNDSPVIRANAAIPHDSPAGEIDISVILESALTPNHDFGGVFQIIAGDGIDLSPDGGQGTVTVAVDASFTDPSGVVATAVAAEATLRTTADNGLSNSLANEIARAEAAEAAAITSAVSTAESVAASAAASAISTAVATERSRAQTAENALISSVGAEVTRAEGAEATLTTAVSSEATTRAAADATLTTAVASEATARGNAITTVAGSVTTEATARAAADTAIAATVTVETARAMAAEAALGGGIASRYTLAIPSGSDDGPAIRSALALGGDVTLGPGLWKINTRNTHSAALPFINNTRLRGSGAGNTIIQNNTGKAGLCCLLTQGADYLVHDIWVEDLTIDENNQTVSTLLGGFTNMYGSVTGTTDLRTSFKNVGLRRVTGINAVTGTSFSYDWVRLLSSHTASGQTACTILDCEFEDTFFLGGNSGILVQGQNSTTGQPVNCLIDRCTFKGFNYHDALTLGIAGNGSAIQVGQHALVGTVTMDTIFGFNSSDVAIEVDNSQNWTWKHIIIGNYRAGGVYIRNIGYALGVSVGGSIPLPAQLTKGGKVTSIMTAAIDPTVAPGAAVIRTDGNTAATAYGDIEVDTVHVIHNMADERIVPALSAQNSSFNRIDIARIVVDAHQLNDSTNTQQIRSGQVKPVSSCRVRIGLIESNLSGTIGSQANVAGFFVSDNGSAVTMDLEIGGVIINHNLTFTGGGAAGENGYVRIGASTPGTALLTIRYRIRGVKVVSAGLQRVGGLRIEGTGNVNVLPWSVIEDCDFSGQTAGGGGEINFSVDTASNASNTQVKTIKYIVGVSPDGGTINLPLPALTGAVQLDLQNRMNVVFGGANGAGPATLTGNITLNVINAPLNSNYFIDAIAGVHTITHPPSTHWIGGPSIPAPSGGRDLWGYFVRGVNSSGVPTDQIATVGSGIA